MVTESTFFEKGIYEKKCELFPNKAVGSVLCVGHSLYNSKPCIHYINHKEDQKYYLSIMKVTIPIVSEVLCNRPVNSQLSIF